MTVVYSGSRPTTASAPLPPTAGDNRHARSQAQQLSIHRSSCGMMEDAESSHRVSVSSAASSSSASSGSGSGSSRLHRLVHKLASPTSSTGAAGAMTSATAHTTDAPSTPVHYASAAAATTRYGRAAGAASPAFSDIDDIPLRPPVFESKFMRELEQQQQQYQSHVGSAPNNSNSSSPRPPLAVSHSSPAAIPTTSSASASASSSPSSSSGSGSGLKRLVRVASNGNLFRHASSPSASVQSPSSAAAAAANTTPHHRKAASLVVGQASTPSPRSRLAASLAGIGISTSKGGHQHSQSVSLNTTTTSGQDIATGGNVPRSALGARDVNVRSAPSIRPSDGNKEAALKPLLYGSKDALASVDELGEGNPRNEHLPDRAPSALSIASSVASVNGSDRPSTTSFHQLERPTMGARMPSADARATPGAGLVRSFNPPSSASSSSSYALGGTTTSGLASGLSESSKRFRSAFRLNKNRTLVSSSSIANGMATPGTALLGEDGQPVVGAASTARRGPMRAARRAVPTQDEQQEEDEGRSAECSQTAAENGQDPAGSDVPDRRKGSPSTLVPDVSSLGEESCPSFNSAITMLRSDLSGLDFPAAGGEISQLRSEQSSYLNDSIGALSGQASSSDISPPELGRGSLATTRSAAGGPDHAKAEAPLDRAQLVLDHFPGTDGKDTLYGSLYARRAPPKQADPAATSPRLVPAEPSDSKAAPATNSVDSSLSRSMLGTQRQEGDGLSQRAPSGHARSVSRRGDPLSLDDLMLVPPSPPTRPEARLPTSTSASSLEGKQGDSDTLVASIPAKPSNSLADAPLNARPQRSRPGRNTAVPEEPIEILQQQQETDKENVLPGASYLSTTRAAAQELEDAKHRTRAASPPNAGAHAAGTSVVEHRRPLQTRQPMSNATANAPPEAPLRRLEHSASTASLQVNQRLVSKASSSSIGSANAGYHPSDRQIIPSLPHSSSVIGIGVYDYAVPVKRSGDTPPDHHQIYSAAHHPPVQFPPSSAPHSGLNEIGHQGGVARLSPPTSALPAPPQDAQHPPPGKRTVGTVTVKGKTYTRMGLLGRGGSSKVFRVSDKDFQVYALKKVDLGKGADSETYQSFLNEIDLLERLRGHDRIIQLVSHEVNEHKKSLIMVMEIGEIDLNNLLQERLGKKSSMNFVRHIWEQMLEAVYVIHQEGIVHTDLKPANFVLVKGALKLIDFGIAKAIPNDTTNIARDQQVCTCASAWKLPISRAEFMMAMSLLHRSGRRITCRLRHYLLTYPTVHAASGS